MTLQRGAPDAQEDPVRAPPRSADGLSGRLATLLAAIKTNDDKAIEAAILRLSHSRRLFEEPPRATVEP